MNRYCAPRAAGGPEVWLERRGFGVIFVARVGAASDPIGPVNPGIWRGAPGGLIGHQAPGFFWGRCNGAWAADPHLLTCPGEGAGRSSRHRRVFPER